MIADKFYIMLMNNEQMNNFVGFGFTAQSSYIKESKRPFKGNIHRFAVYFDKDINEYYYDTIEHQNFNNSTGFNNLLNKLLASDEYTYYTTDIVGSPELNKTETTSRSLAL